MTKQTDVLIITALKSEHAAARAAFETNGVKFEDKDQKKTLPYLTGHLSTSTGGLSISLARPTRMGATSTVSLAASLIERLRPRCLAMCGVCAGNPSEVALGDIIIAECAYAYDEGKRTTNGFEGDHRQFPLNDSLLRTAQNLAPDDLPTHGTASERDVQMWFLEQLYIGFNPRTHPARERYIRAEDWSLVTTKLEQDALIVRVGKVFEITKAGRDFVESFQAYTVESPSTLPFAIHTGPIASGNAVVKDGVTWEMLKDYGVRTVLGLEMEAAAIAQVAHRHDIPRWIVVKGVMDYADPNKEDRIKPFAARASAEVLHLLLTSMSFGPETHASQETGADQSSTQINSVGDVSGSRNTITQIIKGRTE